MRHLTPTEQLKDLMDIPLLSKGLLVWLPESIGHAINIHGVELRVNEYDNSFWFQRETVAFTAGEEVIIQYPRRLSNAVHHNLGEVARALGYDEEDDDYVVVGDAIDFTDDFSYWM